MKTLSISTNKPNIRYFLLAVLFLCSYSCKKSNPQRDMSYHVTCTMDGQPMKFNGKNVGHLDYQAGEEALQVNGFVNVSDTTAAIGFVIINSPSKDSIMPGTYMDTSTDFDVLATFEPTLSAPDEDYEAGTTFYQEAGAGFNPVNHFKATITSLTSETVKGTFSGDFYKDGDPSGTIITVTDGDFYVKRQ